MKTTTVSNLALAAAFAGLLGGTTARLNAQPVSQNNGAQPQTFVEMVLALLENRYPWLGEDEPVRARQPRTN